jgi:N-methylhydantoinase A
VTSAGGRATVGGGNVCFGVDVGGTFTDAVLSDGSRTWRAKAPTTPGRVGDGVLAAAELAAERAGHALAELMPAVRRFGLGTTAVTNTLASRTGRRVGLVTTEGFEELIPCRGARG